jgi:hypothetical protein
MSVHIPADVSVTGDEELELQLIEVNAQYLFVRARGGLREVSLSRGPSHPQSHLVTVFTLAGCTLTDQHGAVLNAEQMASGGGPFAGVLDIAFPRTTHIDLSGTLTLKFAEATARFRLVSIS